MDVEDTKGSAEDLLNLTREEPIVPVLPLDNVHKDTIPVIDSSNIVQELQRTQSDLHAALDRIVALEQLVVTMQAQLADVSAVQAEAKKKKMEVKKRSTTTSRVPLSQRSASTGRSTTSRTATSSRLASTSSRLTSSRSRLTTSSTRSTSARLTRSQPVSARRAVTPRSTVSTRTPLSARSRTTATSTTSNSRIKKKLTTPRMTRATTLRRTSKIVSGTFGTPLLSKRASSAPKSRVRTSSPGVSLLRRVTTTTGAGGGRRNHGMMSNKHKYCYFDISIARGAQGRLIIELDWLAAPKTCENFRSLCTGEKGRVRQQGYRLKKLHYKGTLLHRIIPGFMAQGGDIISQDGSKGESIYGPTFPDENFTLTHDDVGIVSMANSGPHTNNSQFFITFKPTPWLDGANVVFGRIVTGLPLLKKVEKCGSNEGAPNAPVLIKDCGTLADLPKGGLRTRSLSISHRRSSLMAKKVQAGKYMPVLKEQ